MARLINDMGDSVSTTPYKKAVVPTVKKTTTTKKADLPRVALPKASVTTSTKDDRVTSREDQAEKDFNTRQAKKEEIAEEKVVLADAMPDLQQEEVQQAPVKDRYQEILDRIEMQRQQALADSEAMKRAQIAQGTASLQGALGDSQAELARQQQSLDPRYSALKSSAVTGTRVAQKRLSQLLPFSGVMAGSKARQAEDIEVALQNRQSDLDATRAEEAADIAYRGESALRDYNTGLQQVQAGASADEFARNISSSQTADDRFLQQAMLQEERDYNAQLAEQSRLADAQALATQTASKQSSDTLNLAMDKWNMGIPLNEAEAQALGVPAGTTKPKTVTTSGTGGLSASALNTNAKWKLQNGIPLSANEANILGVPEGYVMPGGGDDTPDDPLYDDETIETSLSNFLREEKESGRYGSANQISLPGVLGGGYTPGSNNFDYDAEKQTVMQYLINNASDLSEGQGLTIAKNYGLTLQEVADLFNQ